jgi:phosphoglycerate dehydrogenase-like enzyme
MGKDLRIFVDFALAPDVLDYLRRGIGGHDLLLPGAPAASVLAAAEPDPQLATADIAFGQPDPQAVATATALRWIHVSTSGITRYDSAEFRVLVAARGIPVTNSAHVYNEACAVHALSFLLAQARALPRALQSYAPGGTDEWHALRAASGTLRGETVLIVGYGAIGRRLVELLHPLNVTCLAYRRKPRGDEGVPVPTQDALADVLAHQADHIVNILPDSPETRGFFDAVRLRMIKPGAVFYNIGRGNTVDQAALADALQSGRLRAAWLDVTDPEPLPEGHPLRAAPNCFITPHTAGGHAGEAMTLVKHFLDNLGRFERGEPLLDRVM